MVMRRKNWSPEMEQFCVTNFGDAAQKAILGPYHATATTDLAYAWSQCLYTLNGDKDWIWEYSAGPKGWKLGARCALCDDWLVPLERHGMGMVQFPSVRKHGRAHLMDLGIEKLKAVTSAINIMHADPIAEVIATCLGFDCEDRRSTQRFWRSIRRPE